MDNLGQQYQADWVAIGFFLYLGRRICSAKYISPEFPEGNLGPRS